MKEVVIKAQSGTSRILVGSVFAQGLAQIEAKKKVIVADQKVLSLYREILPNWPLIAIEGGEGAKDLSVVERLYKEFLALELDRSSFVLGLGGGTICDLVGFVAATYFRGLRLGLAPTTLLAQVDASIGGKNGVNFAGFKNLIGTIRQPEVVLCDPLFLRSMPLDEIRSGFAEIVKAAAICDASLFEYLESNCEKVLALESGAIEHALFAALKVKAQIVEADENEKGDRVKLNFGHTVGHAVEATQHIAHGYAVSAGMIVDIKLSQSKLGFSPKDGERLLALLRKCALPSSFDSSGEVLCAAIRKDKKRDSELIKMALLSAIGQSEVQAVSLKEIDEVVYDLCKRS